MLSLINRYKKQFKNGSLYLFSVFFPALIGLITNPWMAQNLSPNDYAIIGYYNSFNVLFLPLMNFSLISYYLRNYYKLPKERIPIVKNTITIALLVYGFLAFIAIFILFFFYWKYSGVSFDLLPYALLAFAPVYLNNMLIMYQVNARIRGEAKRYAKITISSALLKVSFAILFVIVLKYGAIGNLSATLLASSIVFLFILKKELKKLSFDWQVLKDAFVFGWPLSSAAILWYFLVGIDKAMLEKLDDNYTMGFYIVGGQIAGYFGMFYQSIAQTFEPDIYKAIANNKISKLLKITTGILTLNAIPNIIFIIFAPLIISILTYDKYTDAASFAQIIALKNITMSFYYSSVAILVGYGFTKTRLLVAIIGAIISIGMYKLLIDHYAFYGAAWGQVIIFLILSLLVVSTLIFKQKKSKLHE